MKAIVCFAFVLAACGKGDDKKPESTGSGSGGGSATAASGSAKTLGSAAGGGSGSGSAAVAGTLSTKIKAARCGDPCLFLVDTPFDKLLDAYKTECGGMQTKDLGYEDCKKLDYMRNCIYAAHGLVFKKNKWKALTTKPWYDAQPDFKPDAISALERANVHELHLRGKACKKGLAISGGDFERLKKWFAALPKQPSEMPKVIMIEGETKTAGELVTWLMEQVDAKKKKKITLGTGVTAAYETLAELPPELTGALKAPKDAKLRAIMIDFDSGVHGTEENPLTEGTNVRFVYDDKDKLVAITTAHYLYD